MWLRDMTLSFKEYFTKIITDQLFYIGGIIGGTFLYLTGLSVEDLQKILFIIFLDMASRIWAEKANKRPILSKKMWYGFFGKFTSYMILFAAANHAFYIDGILNYIVFGGFSFIEFRSIYENLKEAKQSHLDIIGEKLDDEINKFKNSSSEKKERTI